MKKTGIFVAAGVIAIIVLVAIIWQVKTISGSASLATKETASAESQLIYNKHCARCHGDAGQGFGEKPDIRGSGHQPAEIKEIIKNGLDNMPSFSNIPEPMLSELANYVSSL